jgi:hypothetical protein
MFNILIIKEMQVKITLRFHLLTRGWMKGLPQLPSFHTKSDFEKH